MTIKNNTTESLGYLLKLTCALVDWCSPVFERKIDC